MCLPSQSSRRQFLRRSVLFGAGAAAPYLISSHVLGTAGKPGANDRIGIACIGTGHRARELIRELRRVTGPEGQARIVGLSDVWPKKAHDWLAAYKKEMPESFRGARCAIDLDYHKLLERDDVDAVIVTTCDHWHALPAIHACQAGKDVYGEKPLTLTIREGRKMVEAVRRYGRVFQTGAQQRSYLRNRQGCELVRNGKLGRIKEVRCENYRGSKPADEYQLKTGTVPKGMDWDRWCGQTALAPFSFNRYKTYQNPGWQWIWEYAGGRLTNWGPHGLDMVQWALGTDDTGPVEITPHGNKPDSKVSLRYANGVIVHLTVEGGMNVKGGGHFIGEKGEMIMNRGKFNTIPVAISTEGLDRDDLRLPISDNHMQNWLDCIKSRRRCIADVEIGHRTATICHLCGIARQLGRPLYWDPEKEIIPGDSEADAMLDRPKRKPYALPEEV